MALQASMDASLGSGRLEQVEHTVSDQEGEADEHRALQPGTLGRLLPGKV